MKSRKNIKSILVLATLGIATLFFINISFAVSTAKVNVETANLRKEANSDSTILEQLSLNQEVEILEKEGEWYKVKTNGTTGYLRKDLITLEEETITETEAEQKTQVETETQDNTLEGKKLIIENVKLKIVPSINATDIIEVKKDEEVTVIETINDWVCVQTSTAKGWIRKEKLKSKEEKAEDLKQEEDNKEIQGAVEEKVLKTLYINKETVNVRKEANTSSEIIMKLSLNSQVNVYAEEDGWSKVKIDDKEGYISSALLSDKKQETSRSLETSRKVEETTQKVETTPISSGNGTAVVSTAKGYIGSRYVSGASGPNSFDCSGFTSYIYKQYGVNLNRTAAAQYGNGTFVSREQLQPGDLIMFGPSASGINHVGIYIGGGQIVHAANPSRGVTTDTIDSGYYNNNYVGARRVI